QVEEADLASIVRDVAEELESAHGRRFVLQLERADRGRWDRDKLRRAIHNLAANAIKYGDGTRPVTITADVRMGRAAISVHNFGNRIPEEEKQEIFIPYRRNKNANRPGSVQGWGLGLTFAKG